MRTRQQFERDMKKRDPEYFKEFPEMMEELWRQYVEVGKPLREEEKHPWDYPEGEEDPQYKRDMEEWREGRAEARTARAVANALLATRPVPRPQDLPEGQKVFHFGNAKDKEVFRDKFRLMNEVFRLEEKARRTGNPEFQRMADNFRQEVEGQQSAYTYSFEQAERTKDLEWGEEKLTEIMETWIPEMITENRAYVESLTQGWLDKSDRPYSFFVDTGAPNRGIEGTGKLVKVEHPGTPANELGARKGTTDNERLLSEVGYGSNQIIRAESEKQTPEPEPPEPEGPWGSTQREYEAWAEQKGLPRT
jgi:hypothetical protein